MSIKCPVCRLVLEDEGVGVGEIVYCSKCDKDFEVVKIKPVLLGPLKPWRSEESAEIEADYFD